MTNQRRIVVRAEDVWTFTERNVPLWDILDLFPPASRPETAASPLLGLECDQFRSIRDLRVSPFLT